HARLARGAEERPRVLHRALVRDAAAREAHPVRVVERGSPLEAARQPRRVVEAERDRLHAPAEGVGTMEVAGERPHAPPAIEEPPRDGLSRESERAGDDVQWLHARLLGGSTYPGGWVPSRDPRRHREDAKCEPAFAPGPPSLTPPHAG